ncbi:acid resistance repetitive basic protein Asr [Brenneria sp. g21c3]|uniref:acid resistance repetitive basic protein Asr n=1 Tax=Brenneria sp. g21c3 TaxID=3093893 RepID=UPI002EB1DD5B|nr:acid resistance repetitive basic protein Asr [Brenneria sp. g21c3]
MNKVLVMIAGAALGLSSVAFAAGTESSVPAQATATSTTSAPAKAAHKKHVKKAKATEQQAQATKKHVKKAKPAEQKAQAAKKAAKKAKTAKPATTTPAA